jgi:ketosteroid isomerase-like protein
MKTPIANMRDFEALDRCFDLTVYHDPYKGVAVLEYASEGHTVEGNRPYANRYVSVLTIRDREVAHWRDYLDPVAVFDALGWPEP